MGVAVLLFGLLVGVFHYQVPATDVEPGVTLSAEPAQPPNYAESGVLSKPDYQAQPSSIPETTIAGPYAALIQAETRQQVAQAVADLVAKKPTSASSVVTIALAQVLEGSTLGDVALIAATATKAAPGQAPSIAGAVARTLNTHTDPALAAAIASIVTLVPEQSRDVGLVVGAVIGNDVDALGMVAQTVAISVGEETFSSLSEGSGVSMSSIMKRSSSFGIRVPFDVPNYAAEFAPAASMFADSADDASASAGDM